MSLSRCWWLFILLTIVAVPVVRADLPKPAVSPRCAEIPLLTAVPDWPNMPTLAGGFVIMGTRTLLVSQQTAVKVACDKHNLYILLRCHEERMDNVVALYSGPDIWRDDCVEVFIKPDINRGDYLQFVVSVSGEKYAWDNDKNEIPGGWDVSVLRDKSYWQAEITIPFALLGTRSQNGNIMGASFCRERQAGGGLELSTWTPPRGFHQPDGRLIIGRYVDFLKVVSGDIEKSLLEVDPLLRAAADDSKIKRVVDSWRNLLRETNNRLQRDSMTADDFAAWLQIWEGLKKTSDLKEVSYEVGMEKLLDK